MVLKKASNSGIKSGEGEELPRKLAIKWKNKNIQAEIPEAALQDPFRIRKSNQELLHM